MGISRTLLPDWMSMVLEMGNNTLREGWDLPLSLRMYGRNNGERDGG